MLLIFQPQSRRRLYTTSQFLRLYTLNNNTDNYVYITRKGKIKVFYIVNHGKAINYKLYNMQKEWSKIKVDNNELENYIKFLFIEYPRKYLFENPKTEKPLSDAILL